MKKNRKFFSTFLVFLFLLAMVNTRLWADGGIFWEKPSPIVNQNSVFPKVASDSVNSVLFWQEYDDKTGQIYLSCSQPDGNGQKFINSKFAGPFNYSGEVPDIYSVTMNKKGKIIVVVESGDNSVTIYNSEDFARTFSAPIAIKSSKQLIAPRVYTNKNGIFVIFASVVNKSQNAGLHDFSISMATSSDGLSWSNFNSIPGLASLKNPFYPVLVSDLKSDYLICQAQYQDDVSTTYQLYSAVSNDGLRSWSQPVLITGEQSFASIEDFSDYDNQRPNALCFKDSIYVIWERCVKNENASSIWVQQINAQGTISATSEKLTESANAKNGILFSYDSQLYSSWYDNRSGQNSVYISSFDGVLWETEKLSSSKNNALFPIPLINQNRLAFAWQEDFSSSSSRIILRLPDTTVYKPTITAFNYKEGKRSKNKKVRFSVSLPKDSSGIDGYVYSWSKDSSVEPEHNGTGLMEAKNSTLSLSCDEEGLWFVKVKVLDGAGNWSDSAVFNYFLDLTPPQKPVISQEIQAETNTFKSSNTFTLEWSPSPQDEDIVGYSYGIKYLGPVSSLYTRRPGHPLKVSEQDLNEYSTSLLEKYQSELLKGAAVKQSINARIPSCKFYNLRNGVYVFSVAAVDSVGYVGESLSFPVLLNSYIPKTLISSLKTKESSFGELSFDILGQDFLYDGTISRIYIDKDGKSPYDLTILKNQNGFKVSENKISGINIGSELDEGQYYVGIVHSERGLVMTRTPALKVETNGTVKVDKEYEYIPKWKAKPYVYLKNVKWALIILYIILIFASLLTILFAISLIKNIKDILISKNLVLLLEKGELMAQKIKVSSERKGSLKTSLLGFITSAIVVSIILISVLLGTTMLSTQERTLTSGLQQRVDVLLQSIVTGANSSLPSEDLLELSQLHNQMSSLSEAEYITVTGVKNSSFDGISESILHVWDSNDQNIKEKIDRLNSRRTSYEPGVSLLSNNSENYQEIEKKCIELDSYLLKNYEALLSQRKELLLQRNSAARGEIPQLNEKIQKLDQELKLAFENDSLRNSGSIPKFQTEKLNTSITDYLFYQPIVYRSNSDAKLVHGIVFLQVSTESLVNSVNKAKVRIMIIVLSISVILIALGVIVSLLFANAIVRPIRRLEKAVKDISEEHDKERLLGNKLENLPNNEIGRLGDSVNRMQMDLGWNAQELNLQLNASEIQQALVPLEPLAGNVKQNISKITESQFDQFAYYKGAAGVSGDYFDCKRLDDRWYVLIKCDASGHAAPAGILVTIIATLYKKYFENWSYAKNGTKLQEFVYKANDFLEGLNIKGKFVAMFISLYDSKTGDLYMCHAGDKLLRIYDSAAKVLNKIELPETPAVGPIPSFMVEMKGGYTVHKAHLNPNDILLLYTDGIEENGRSMRNPDFTAVMKPKLNQNGEQLQDEYGNFLFEAEKEEFGENRVKEITEAVLHRKKYVLTKDKNPTLGESLEFDLTTCQGTTQDVILALSSMEKVFRFYKPRDVSEKDLVEVDIAIDKFLKEHFNLYSEYCQISELKPKNPNYVFYKNLKEDVQEDDLTMLAIKRS